MTTADSLFVECLGDAIRGDKQNFSLSLNRLIQCARKDNPELAKKLSPLLKAEPQPLRKTSSFHNAPVDADTRKHLLVEEHPSVGDANPIWNQRTQSKILQAVEERQSSAKLIEHGLQPIKSLLFHGDPGLGKTISARWLAAQLELPLLTLDLATVMSSFLGKTGNNIKAIFEYAKQFPCVLLLDEFDAIAKKRDDDSEVGELKRLVTVLLQEIDSWPVSSVLIAATNHEDLLDPAAWRRFDQVIHFEHPDDEEILLFLKSLSLDETCSHVILGSLRGKSYSAIEQMINDIKKKSVMNDISFLEGLFDSSKFELHEASKDEIKLYAKVLHQQGKSQRSISQLTGLARQTVRKVIVE
ncbi:MAG: AAA family ATPase [Pseudomonadota bacterium]